jgi:hypothetical protein
MVSPFQTVLACLVLFKTASYALLHQCAAFVSGSISLPAMEHVYFVKLLAALAILIVPA